jgi:hypothetical protein
MKRLRSYYMNLCEAPTDTGEEMGEQMDPTRNESSVKATPFDYYGAGHMRPNRAMDPGLVYDLTTDDYLGFLYNIKHSKEKQNIISNNTTKHRLKK